VSGKDDENIAAFEVKRNRNILNFTEQGYPELGRD
jgi:hypothetical protein